jgi:two-component system, NtrC family, nitrogen regulation sensor histidine kinase NtrY
MVFKNFRIQVILRIVLLTVVILTFAWCVVHGLYLRSVYLAAGIIIMAAEFVWYADRFNRDIKTFMVSLMQRDFTTHYQETGKGRSFNELYQVLNMISSTFRNISAEKEAQYRYLEMLVEHVRVSILSVDREGRIHLANQALKDMLQKHVLTTLKALESLDAHFVMNIREIRSGETRLVKLSVNNEVLQLSVHASEFMLEGRYYKLISMQNIRNELDLREMEAWQKLIRVLSHEIMNSVAPIISLSSTLHGLVTQARPVMPEALDKGLEAIKIRSEGLYNFTQSYRKLTGIPNLSLKVTNLKELLERVRLLMQAKLDEYGIALKISGADVAVSIDPELMEHVLINLLLNAVEALTGKAEASINITTSKNMKGNVRIHVADNGEGMDEATLEEIFIPFFTTRTHGSGIGLAITKQILQLHHADIQVHSERGRGTEFVIVL